MLKQKLLEEYNEVFDCNDHLPCMNGDPMKIHLQKRAIQNMQYMEPERYHFLIPFAFQEETKKL